jgi:hypothetical protein
MHQGREYLKKMKEAEAEQTGEKSQKKEKPLSASDLAKKKKAEILAKKGESK